MRTRHILRMQQGHCSIEAGFVWSDLLTNLERTSDHCSNICLLYTSSNRLLSIAFFKNFLPLAILVKLC